MIKTHLERIDKLRFPPIVIWWCWRCIFLSKNVSRYCCRIYFSIVVFVRHGHRTNQDWEKRPKGGLSLRFHGFEGELRPRKRLLWRTGNSAIKIPFSLVFSLAKNLHFPDVSSTDLGFFKRVKRHLCWHSDKPLFTTFSKIAQGWKFTLKSHILHVAQKNWNFSREKSSDLQDFQVFLWRIIKSSIRKV